MHAGKIFFLMSIASPVSREFFADMASLNLPKTVNIDDDFQGFNKDAFCIQKHYQDSIHKVLVPHGMIQDRITKLANDIFTDSREAGRHYDFVI